ncbi:MAG: hypothetical protein R3E79_26595 [Caldilineaceae bacterium]
MGAIAGGAFATRHLTNYELLDLDNLAAGWQDRGPLPFPPLVSSAFATFIGDSLYLFGGYECWTAANTPPASPRCHCLAL